MSRRLYVPPASLSTGTLILRGDDHHYLFRVLRLRAGAVVLLFDGRGREADAVVEGIEKERATLRVGDVRAHPPAQGPRIEVLVSLIKGERMEWCVQKLVELGAARILPIRTARSVVKLDGERAETRRRRWEAIAKDAARQCGSTTVPEIAPVTSLQGALEDIARVTLKLAFWERARDRSLREALPEESPESIALLIGPEGGLVAREVESAAEAGFVSVGLGPRVLRAETAAVAAMAAVGYALGDLG